MLVGMARRAVTVAERSVGRRNEYCRAQYVARFVPPAPRGLGQRSVPSLPGF